MNIIIRTDASHTIGIGHLMRCLTISERLRKLGANVEYVIRDHPGNINEQIQEKGFKVNLLSSSTTNNKQQTLIGYEKWLGVKQHIDADETIQFVKNREIDWIIIDHYALDYKWEERIRLYTKKIMVIDDLANRKHDCDLLLDQNLLKNMDSRYNDILSEKTVQLLGPQYALLQPEYEKLRVKVKHRHQPLKHVLIFFGGTDKYNLTGLTLNAFLNNNISLDKIDIVLSQQNSNYIQINDLVDHMSNITLHSNLSSLAPIILNADFAVGAGGATNWERLCLGLPSIVISIAENQKPVSNNLHNMGMIQYIGDAETIRPNDIVSSVKNIMGMDDIHNWSKRCLNICSGKGVSLVSDAIFKLSHE